LIAERELYNALYAEDLEELSPRQKKSAEDLKSRIESGVNDLYAQIVRQFFPQLVQLPSN
jgi:hypothetical protein